jgi:hypothetical protein
MEQLDHNQEKNQTAIEEMTTDDIVEYNRVKELPDLVSTILN